MSRIATVLLAAGAARRFGAQKLQEAVDGVPMLAGRIVVAEAVTPGQVYVVLAEDAAWSRSLVTAARVVINAHAEAGMGTSIAAAIRALDASVDGALILPADQVAVTADDLHRLIEVHVSSEAGISCARYGGTLGAPALFARHWFEQLAQLRGDRGARDLLRTSHGVMAVDLPNAAVDIDTPADLASYRSLSATR